MIRNLSNTKNIIITSKLFRFFSKYQFINPPKLLVLLYSIISKFSNKIEIPIFSKEKSKKNLYGKKILIAMYRASISSNFLDLLIYKELKNRGAKVKVALCSGSGFPCDNISAHNNILFYRCVQCKSIQDTFLKTIDQKDVVFINKSNTRSISNTLSQNAIASAKRFDRKDQYDYTLAKEYQLIYESIYKFLSKQEKYDLMFMSHGLYGTWGAFRDFCIDNQINYVTWGRSYFGKMLAVCKNTTLHEGIQTFNLNKIKPGSHKNELKILHNSLKQREKIGPPNSDSINYYKYLEKRSIKFESDNHLVLKKPIIAIYLSIPWDGTVYGSNGDFKSQKDLIDAILENSNLNLNFNFVFRSHPNEDSMPEKASNYIINKLSSLESSNVYVIEPKNTLTSYQLSKKSALNILYSGTLSLEIAYARKPIIICGRNLLYGASGLKFISKKNELKNILKRKKFSTFIPSKKSINEILKKISMVHYEDTLTQTEDYKVLKFKRNKNLINRIINEHF